MGNTPFHNTVLNKYNAHSMATEIIRGLSDSPALGLIEVDEGQWYDPQTNFTKLLPFEVASRSEEHTSELQSLMRISYAVFCLKTQKTQYSMHDQNDPSTA